MFSFYFSWQNIKPSEEEPVEIYFNDNAKCFLGENKGWITATVTKNGEKSQSSHFDACDEEEHVVLMQNALRNARHKRANMICGAKITYAFDVLGRCLTAIFDGTAINYE